MSEQEAALLASSGAAEAEAEARSEGEVSASGPADTEAVEGVQRPGPGRFKEQTGWTWLLTLNEDYASKAQQLFDACEDKRAGAKRKPAVEGVEIGPNQEIMLVWKWLAAYKAPARWLKPLLDECGIPVKATILKSADATEGRTAQRETPAARDGAHRPAVRRPSAKIKARSSPLESPAPAAASSGAHRPAAAEPKRKRPRRRLPVPDEPGEPGQPGEPVVPELESGQVHSGRARSSGTQRKKQRLSASRSRQSAAGAGVSISVAHSARKMLRRTRISGKQPEPAERARPLGGSPRRPSSIGCIAPVDADGKEPHEPWLFQKAWRHLSQCSETPPPDSRVDRPWESGVNVHRYVACNIWKYDHREHGHTIAKVLPKEKGFAACFCRRWTSCRGFAIRTSSRWWTPLPPTTRWS